MAWKRYEIRKEARVIILYAVDEEIDESMEVKDILQKREEKRKGIFFFHVYITQSPNNRRNDRFSFSFLLILVEVCL